MWKSNVQPVTKPSVTIKFSLCEFPYRLIYPCKSLVLIVHHNLLVKNWNNNNQKKHKYMRSLTLIHNLKQYAITLVTYLLEEIE